MAVRLLALGAGRSLLPRRFLILVSFRGCVNPRAVVRLERLGKFKKKSMTSSGIESTTFLLMPQYLKQLKKKN
jgi:hypothetical protein